MYSQEHLKRNSAACFEAKGLSGGAFLSLSYPQLVTANTHETTAETGGGRPDQTAQGCDSAGAPPARHSPGQSRNPQPERRHDWDPTPARNTAYARHEPP